MKRLTLLLFLLFAASKSQAQQAEIYITSYDDTGQIVYVCDGQTQNSVPVQYALVNLNKSVPVKIDSIVPSGDPTSFPILNVEYVGFELYEVSTGTDALYYPTKVGDDTIHETVYYNGQYTTSAAIVFHARSSPNLAMYGNTITTAYSVGGNSFGEINQEDETDTLHDEMMAGVNPLYFLGSAQTENGGIYNQPVTLRSCGGATIDSIYESGDFSEFSFDPFPTLPYTMPGEDSLVLNFEFSPKVIDTLGIHHHYLIFHSTDGHYLTWSFEYKVYPASSVGETPYTANGIRIFPNPASDELQILGVHAGTIRLFDLLGRERLDANNDGSDASLDVSKLESGMYILRSGSETARVVISH